MCTLTVPNAGQAIIAFTMAKVHAQARYNAIQNCQSCDKERAAQWARDVKLYEDLIGQLEDRV